MPVGTIVLIILVLLLIGALPSWPYSADWGVYPAGSLGVVLIVVLILYYWAGYKVDQKEEARSKPSFFLITYRLGRHHLPAGASALAFVFLVRVAMALLTTAFTLIGKISRLFIVAVGLQEVVLILSRGVKLFLRYGRRRRPHRFGRVACCFGPS
jgi:hypothetical protein